MTKKRINRKQVDQFLIELDAFLEKYSEQLTEDDILDFILPIKMSKPWTFRAKWEINLPTLVKLVNIQGRKNRTEQYVRKAAYAADLHIVKWISYTDIFHRILKRKWKVFLKEEKWLILKNFYEKYWDDFILPVEYGDINTDLLYKWSYVLLK